MFDEKIIRLCAETRDLVYLYDERTILDQMKELQNHFPQIEFLYSIKCNSNPYILKSVFSHQFGADAASAEEVDLARNAGLPSGRIYYSAPGKSIRDLEHTIGRTMIIADSLNEIEKIQSIAESQQKVVRIGIRIHPNVSFDGNEAAPSKFGIDENQAFEFIHSNSCRHIKIVGIHVHLKSQILNAELIAAYYQRIFQLAKRFAQVLGDLEYINLGSGMGVPYAPNDTELDLGFLGKAAQNSIDAFRSEYPNTKLLIEVGRFAVCKSGIYITKVMDRKVSCGRTYLILKNTLNGFLRPSLAKLVESYSPEKIPAGAEPLFTAKNAFEIIPLKKTGNMETVYFGG